MIRDPAESFADLLPVTYPGSRHAPKGARAPSKAPPAGEESEAWDSTPYIRRFDGQDIEFFFIGALATAMGRSSNTIRRWISAGIIPASSYRMNSASVKGQRRLWTRAEIEGIARIAREEGLPEGRNVNSTEFPQRVKELFRVLKKEGKT